MQLQKVACPTRLLGCEVFSTKINIKAHKQATTMMQRSPVAVPLASVEQHQQRTAPRFDEADDVRALSQLTRREVF